MYTCQLCQQRLGRVYLAASTDRCTSRRVVNRPTYVFVILIVTQYELLFCPLVHPVYSTCPFLPHFGVLFYTLKSMCQNTPKIVAQKHPKIHPKNHPKLTPILTPKLTILKNRPKPAYFCHILMLVFGHVLNTPK